MLSKLKIVILILACGLIASCADNETEVPAPTIYFSSDGSYEISLTDTLLLSPKITYDKNSSYQWIQNGNLVATTLEYEFIPTNLTDYNLTFNVENANGSDSYDIKISVVEHIDFSEFENFAVPTKTGLYMQPDTLENFITQNATFSNVINADTTMWSGFAFSNRTSKTTTLSTSAIGCAYATTSSNAYMAVSCYLPGAVIDFDKQYSIKSIDITSDNFAYLVSKFGFISADSTLTIAYPAAYDYIKLHIKGLDNNGNVISEETTDLVNCCFDNPAKYTRLTEWKTVNLKSLGNVYGLKFEIESTVNDFPPFFCVDNLKLQD